jgi:DNA-binding Lrp family transcriptional regulator
MSIQMIRQVRSCIASDDRLSPVDKLILLEYAWNTPEHGAPRAIRFKTYARALGLHRGNIRDRVRQLTDWGYFEEVAVIVKAGARLAGGWSATPTPEKGGDGQRPLGGRSATPKGDGERPPLKEKDKKKEPAALNLDFQVKKLTAFQRSSLLSGKPFLIGGQLVGPSSPEAASLLSALRAEDAEKGSSHV